MKRFISIVLSIICALNIANITSCKKKVATPQQDKPDAENVSKLSPTIVDKKKGPIAEFETTLLDKDPDRVKNIKVAINVVNGYTVQPGEVFSFNDVVGKRKPEKGYRKARIIVKNKSEEGYGGGICQLSSTIYNAVEKAGLEVVERHSHSKDVHYVPLDRDAAINYGTMDFKFKNTANCPIKITANIKNDKVYVSIVEV